MMTFLFIMCALFIVLVAFKCYEQVVCTELCKIYVSLIVSLDMFGERNNNFKKMWDKVMLKLHVNELMDKDINEILQFIALERKLIDKFIDSRPKLCYSSNFFKSIVLYKHHISNEDIVAIESICLLAEKEVVGLTEKMNQCLHSNNSLNTDYMFVEVCIDSFQHNVYAGFYGVLEALCSFPKSSLVDYYEVCQIVKYLPIDVSLKKRKEDYSMLQNQEYEAQKKILKNFDDLLGSTEDLVEEYTNSLLKRIINFFFAGSKELEAERNIFANQISLIQTQCINSLISVYGYSYQNFERQVIDGGQEAVYCKFICNDTDSIVFVLNEKIGEYTKLEFDMALESFKNQGKPFIYIYAKRTVNNSIVYKDIKERIDGEKQFWVDYADNEQLGLLIGRDLMSRINRVNEEINNKRRSIFKA